MKILRRDKSISPNEMSPMFVAVITTQNYVSNQYLKLHF